ncbi:hypothetical protein AOLI_G00189870 [Acnodon oligacanthus]
MSGTCHTVTCQQLFFTDKLQERGPFIPLSASVTDAVNRLDGSLSLRHEQNSNVESARSAGRGSNGVVVKFADDVTAGGQRGGLRRGGQLPDAPAAGESARSGKLRGGRRGSRSSWIRAPAAARGRAPA